MRVRPPQAPWLNEDCAHPAPPDWTEIPGDLAKGGDPARAEGRLRPELVAVAARPVTALVQAVLQPPQAQRLALAFAEIAVTGHRAHAEFVRMDPPADPAALVRRVIGLAQTADPHADPATLAARAPLFVDRARKTSRWLRARTARERKAAYVAMHPNLPFDQRPWVAVAGEIDPPDRPVNMPATALNQDDVLVPVPQRAAPIRARVASSDAVTDATSHAKIVVFLHGLGSRLEETSAVAASLVAKGYGVLALDLPNQGYSERFSFADVGLTDMANTGTRDAAGHVRVYAMDFYVDFIGRLLKAFDAQFPAGRVLSRIVAIGGGSEGGCLSLRLATSLPTVVRRALPWSPGAVWESFLDNDLVHHLVLRDGPIHDVTSDENPQSRGSYISGNFDVPLGGGVGAFIGMPRPADTWWRNGWRCKPRSEREARMMQWEIYHPWFRRWCAAMAHEQLAYSFRSGDTAAPLGGWPVDAVTIPLLLMTGAADEVMFADICSATQSIGNRAQRLGAPHGYQLTFPTTGHSIHDERPEQLAQEIDLFLRDVGPFP